MKYRYLFFTLTIALLTFSTSNAVNENFDYPETHAGKHLKKFTTALNSGIEENWKNYILEDPKAVDSANVLERRLGLFQFVFEDLGGIELLNITENKEYQIEVLTKGINPSGGIEFAWLGMMFDTLPPHGWAAFDLRPADDPNEVFPEGKLTAEKMKTYLDEFIDGLVAKDKFSGAVMVAKDGIPLYTRVDGEACKRYSVPNKLDTKFNLGSMNKMFTGVAIGQLVQNGKLSFDDFVGQHLPDYPNEDVKNKVTIHHLLTHTSGTGDYWDPLFNAKWWEIKTVQQLADLTAENPLDFEPGERFSYSNCGPIILGLIIEKISGMSYDEYIRQNIAKPAGMINTDCYEVDRPVENLAIGYTKRDYNGEPTDYWMNNLFMHASKGGPAGGGYSTVEDLLKFDIALRNYTLLDKKYFDAVTTGKVEMGPDMKYAYLFGDEINNGQRIIGHNGGAPGINAVLDMFMDCGYTVAVMANYDGAAMLILHKISNLIIKTLDNK